MRKTPNLSFFSFLINTIETEELQTIKQKTYDQKIDEKNQELKHLQDKLLDMYDILNKSNITIFFLQNNATHSIDYVNQNIEHIIGYTSEELLQKKLSYYELINPEDKELVKTQLNLNNKKTKYRMITKTGDIRWVEDNTFIKTNEKGNITHYQKILQDITENIQKELAMNNTTDGISIINTDKTYSYVNQTFANIYGYTSTKDLIGKNYAIIFQQHDQNRLNNEIIPELKKNGYWKGDAIGIKKDGTKFYQDINLNLLDQESFSCIIRDVTRQKLTMNELADAHNVLYVTKKELERRINERTNQITQMMKQKDDFINQLGHDLKTPLSPLLNLLPRMEVEDEKSKERLDISIRCVHYMKDLVIKTLELAYLNLDRVEFEYEDINLLLETRSLLETFKPLFNEKELQVHLQISKDLYINADKIQFKEVMNNILINAAKYSKHKGQITINAKEQDSMILLSIKDDGIGMSKEETTHIFDEFYKADTSRHALDSSGLGLSICKRIIEKHGGTIWASSPGKNQGSTFYFTFKKSSPKHP